MTQSEIDLLISGQYALLRAIESLTVRLAICETKLNEALDVLQRQSRSVAPLDCTAGVRAAVQMTAACCSADCSRPASLVEHFELLHQSVVDCLKREVGNVHVPAPTTDQ